MNDFVPTTGAVRGDFILAYTRNHDSYMTGVSLDSIRNEYGTIFDSWLRKVEAQAWAKGYDDGFGDGGVNAWDPDNPYES